MYITPVNNQSFTGFRLKGNGAKALAEKFVSNPEYEKTFTRRIINPLKKINTDVIYDGEDVFVKNIFGKKKVTDFVDTDYFMGDKYSVYGIETKSFNNKKIKEHFYIPDGGRSARKTLNDTELTGIPHEFFAAKQIALYENILVDTPKALPAEDAIEAKAKELQFLYGKTIKSSQK